MSGVDVSPIGSLGGRRRAQKASPFGRLEQRELEYMRLLRFDASDRLLFAVLKVRYDARSGTVMDRISTMADWSGMSERNVQACLKRLQGYGLIERERHPNRGGTRGQAWSWSTAIRRYEDWPAEPLAVLVAASVACVSVFRRARKNTRDLRAQTEKSTQETIEEGAENGARERTATRHNQESSPDIPQERDDPIDNPDEEDGGSDLARRLGKSWVQYRKVAGLERFTDETAVRWLTERVERAVEAGCTSDDLGNAVDRYSEVDFADPRRFIGWALAERDERLRTERDRERSREFRAKRDQEDAEFDRLRAQPGYSEEVTRVLGDLRAQLEANK